MCQSLLIFFTFVSLSTSATASTYEEMLNFFERGEKATLALLRTYSGTIRDNGKCVNVMDQQRILTRAVVFLPVDGTVEPTVYVGFEHFSGSESDDQLRQAAQHTHEKYWGAMMQNRLLGAYQKSYGTTVGYQYLEFRIAEANDGKTYLLRKHYAEHDIITQYAGRSFFIPAGEVIEICWSGQ